MFNWIINLSLLLLSISNSYYAYKEITGTWQFVLFFISGILFGIFIMNLKLNVKNSKINSYQRQLEKEAISSDENLAKVKVLESKIQVLEKALENALNKDK